MVAKETRHLPHENEIKEEQDDEKCHQGHCMGERFISADF